MVNVGRIGCLGLPSQYRPEWLVQHLVFQGGRSFQRQRSMTGGGFLPARQWAGREAPSWQVFTPSILSIAGGGTLPGRPNFLAPLGGPSTSSQF